MVNEENKEEIFDEELDEETRQAFEDLEEEIGSFDILDALENNGRALVNKFLEKTRLFRRRRKNFIEKQRARQERDGILPVGQRRYYASRFFFEFIDMADGAITACFLHANAVLGKDKAKEILAVYAETIRAALTDYVEEERKLFTNDGMFAADERSLYNQFRLDSLEKLDVQQAIDDVINKKLAPISAKFLGTTVLYSSFALAIGVVGEAISHGQAMLANKGSIERANELLGLLEGVLLELNERVPIFDLEIDEESQFNILRTYMAPDAYLLDDVQEIDVSYQNKIDGEIDDFINSAFGSEDDEGEQ